MPRLVRPTVGLALVVAASLAARSAEAHGLRSAYVEVTEGETGHALVAVRLAVDAPGVRPRLSGCALTPIGDVVSTDAGDRLSYSARCERPLAGTELVLDGLGPVVAEGVVWVRLADGRALSHLVTDASPSWVIPGRQEAWPTARRYVALGAEHVASGADHLLFLLLLVLTVRTPRAVLLAETAFTVSHGLAYTATALGWISVASAPAEACIALSLVLLALDVGRPGSRAPGAREIALLSLVFGAIHGLGFAGGLREAGLPDAHVTAAMLGFGGGIELAQVATVGAVLGALALLRRSGARTERAFVLASAYGAGVVATWWLLERVALLVLPPSL